MLADGNECLIGIQNLINEKYNMYIKKDFDLRLKYHISIKRRLEQRKSILESSAYFDFYQRAIMNHKLARDILPLNDENSFDSSWINKIVVEYREGYETYLEIVANENQYFRNNKIYKLCDMQNTTHEHSIIDWKKTINAPIFRYIEEDNDDVMVFDILYDVYINAVRYYFLGDDFEGNI